MADQGAERVPFSAGAASPQHEGRRGGIPPFFLNPLSSLKGNGTQWMGLPDGEETKLPEPRERVFRLSLKVALPSAIRYDDYGGSSWRV